MQFADDEVRELARYFGRVQQAVESEITYFLIPDLKLPTGCTPPKLDSLLCPSLRDGYQSRLFFAAPVGGGPARNWTPAARILERNWYAVSWRTPAGLRLAQMVSAHLDALRQGV